MITHACPKGHASETDDFCDTCGAKIGAPTPLPARVPNGATPDAGSPAAGPGGNGGNGAGASGGTGAAVTNGAGANGAAGSAVPCPHCGMPRAGTGRFCEDCGFDHHTGKVPALTPAAAPAPAAAGPWTATIAADRGYFEANGIEGVDFPAHTTTRTLDLPPPQVRIGRRSVSQGTDPDIDLRDDDPGVSHNQALLTLSIDGVWLLSDLGSTNGTYLNDEQKPVTAGHSRALKAGDRIHVGAWTTITLHAPPAS